MLSATFKDELVCSYCIKKAMKIIYSEFNCIDSCYKKIMATESVFKMSKYFNIYLLGFCFVFNSGLQYLCTFFHSLVYLPFSWHIFILSLFIFEPQTWKSPLNCQHFIPYLRVYFLECQGQHNWFFRMSLWG